MFSIVGSLDEAEGVGWGWLAFHGVGVRVVFGGEEQEHGLVGIVPVELIQQPS